MAPSVFVVLAGMFSCCCLLLLAVVLFSTSSDIHNQMLRGGEQLWSGYYKLRMDPAKPECDANRDIEAAVAEEMAREAPADDPMAALLGTVEKDPADVRLAIERSVADCRSAHASYESLQGQLTAGVKAYRAVELFVADLIAFGLSAQRYILVILVMLCAVTATLTRHHIAMRAMETRLDYTVSLTLQTIANAMLLGSSLIFRQSTLASSTAVSGEELLLHNFWISGFGCLTRASLNRLVRVPDGRSAGGSRGQAFLSVPLYSDVPDFRHYFAMITPGIGIYLGKMMELADMFLNGLYVWVGMMLKQNGWRHWCSTCSALAHAAGAAGRRCRAGAAVPTAHTGASGIFVIAAGAVIYSELRAGARRHRAGGHGDVRLLVRCRAPACWWW